MVLVRGVKIIIRNFAILLQHTSVGMECKISDGSQDASICMVKYLRLRKNYLYVSFICIEK